MQEVVLISKTLLLAFFHSNEGKKISARLK